MTEQQKDPSKEKLRKIAGVFIPVGLFIGMGIGWMLDNFVPVMFIGLGAGFLANAIITVIIRNR